MAPQLRIKIVCELFAMSERSFTLSWILTYT